MAEIPRNLQDICGNGYNCCGNTAGMTNTCGNTTGMEFIAAGNRQGVFGKRAAIQFLDRVLLMLFLSFKTSHLIPT